MNTVKEWCKQVRDLGVLVGVGTHKPEVIAQVEDEGWDVDFYAGCVYNRTRTREEWKKVLNGEMLEMSERDLSAERSAAHVPRHAADHQTMLRLQDPGRRDASRPTASTRHSAPRSKASSRSDGIYVGMFPRVKDEVQRKRRASPPDSDQSVALWGRLAASAAWSHPSAA